MNPKVSKICLECGKEYFVYPYQVKETKYCSRKCRIKSKVWLEKMTQIAIDLRGKEKIRKICLNCNKEYFVRPYLENISKLCSNVCHGKYYFGGWNRGKTKKEYPQMSNSGVKKGNIPWNKGKGKGIRKYKYTIGFCKSFKEIVRDRFGRKCQVCGCPEIECRQKLSIHHIDYNPKNLEFNNLIPLCRSCHSKTNGNKENRKKWNSYFKEIINDNLRTVYEVSDFIPRTI